MIDKDIHSLILVCFPPGGKTINRSFKCDAASWAYVCRR